MCMYVLERERERQINRWIEKWINNLFYDEDYKICDLGQCVDFIVCGGCDGSLVVGVLYGDWNFLENVGIDEVRLGYYDGIVVS